MKKLLLVALLVGCGQGVDGQEDLGIDQPPDASAEPDGGTLRCCIPEITITHCLDLPPGWKVCHEDGH